MKLKHVLISLILIILSLSLVCCQAPENIPTERDVISSGYWYNEDRSACFKFDADSDEVMLYSLNSGSYTYNFGNVLEGKYSLEKCTVTFGEDTKYYLFDGNVITLDEEKFLLDTANAPTLNTAPMESATALSLDTPISVMPSNPGINEKIYFKFSPEKGGRYLFDFAVSDETLKQKSMSESSATYIWILDSEFRLMSEGNDDVNVFLSRSKTYYIIATVSAVSSDTGTNTLTVTNLEL